MINLDGFGFRINLIRRTISKKGDEGDDNSKDPEEWTDAKKARVSKALISMFQDDRYVAHKQETYRNRNKKDDKKADDE